MAITRVQGKATSAVTTGLTFSAALTNPATNGNTLVGAFIWDATTTTDTATITDDKSNTYTTVDLFRGLAAGKRTSYSFFLTNISNAPQTFTITFSASITSVSVAIVVDEFSGIATSSPLDGHHAQWQSTNTTATDNLTSGSFTTAAAGDLIYGGTGESTSITGNGTGFSTGTSSGSAGYRSEFLVQGSAGATAATYTASANNSNFFTFGFAMKAAPAAVAYIPPRRPGPLLVNRTVYI